MPRAVKGIGRTGSKHKKKAVGGPEAQPKISEGLGAPPSTPVPQETATAVDQVAAQAGPAPSVEEDLVERLRRLRYPDPPEPCPHPRYADPSWNGYEKVGYRGANSGAYGDEKCYTGPSSLNLTLFLSPSPIHGTGARRVLVTAASSSSNQSK